MSNSTSSSNNYTYPFLSVAPPSLDVNLTPALVAKQIRNALTKSEASVYARGEQGFEDGVAIFNGAVRTYALALVRPKDALDVSRVVRYCRDMGLELSVKAGGFGTHGWSVAGHVVLDLSVMNDVFIALPAPPALSLKDSIEAVTIRRTLGFELLSSKGSKRIADTTQEADDAPNVRRRKVDQVTLDKNLGKMSSERLPAKNSSDTGSGSGLNIESASGTVSTAEAAFLSDGVMKIKYSGTERSGESPTYLLRSPSHSAPRTTYVNPSPTLVVDSALRTVSHLELNINPDPPAYTIVTFGAGTHSKDLDRVTSASEFGAFHVPSSAFPVGAGQFTAGGFGFLGRRYGLAMDNVIEAEIVLADGRVVWVGENGEHAGEWKDDENPDELWWALRGAGPIFGIVTRFRAKAYYIPSVYAGNFIYLFEHETTPSLLRHLRDCIKGSPRTLYINIILTAGPPGAPAIVVIQLCHSGSRAEGELFVQAISSWEGARCLFQDFSERTFERQQLAVEEVLRGSRGRKWFIKSDMLTTLGDDVIDQTCERFTLVPDGCTWLFEFTGNSHMADVKDSCFPVGHREAQFTVAALHQWSHDETAQEDERCVITAEAWIKEVIHPNSPGGPLPCFLQSASEVSFRSTFGESVPRLKRLKTTLDPTNFFRHAMWPLNGIDVSSTSEAGEYRVRDRGSKVV